MAEGHPPAAAMASYRCSSLPLQTLRIPQKSAQLRRQKVTQQTQHAPRPQAKATTRPQQWLKGTPLPKLIALTISYCMWIYHYHWWPLIIKWLIINKLSGSQHGHCLTLAHLAEFELIRVHLAAGCNFSLLEKQTAICLSCCPSPSLSLQYPPSN